MRKHTSECENNTCIQNNSGPPQNFEHSETNEASNDEAPNEVDIEPGICSPSNACTKDSASKLEDSRQQNVHVPFWRRVRWGISLSHGGRNAFISVLRGELKTAIASVLEVSIMGSALVLTVGMQIQEVVGSRGGFLAQDGNAVAKHVFMAASALSFALSLYSIVTSSVLLLSLSTCPARYV